MFLCYVLLRNLSNHVLKRYLRLFRKVLHRILNKKIPQYRSIQYCSNFRTFVYTLNIYFCIFGQIYLHLKLYSSKKHKIRSKLTKILAMFFSRSQSIFILFLILFVYNLYNVQIIEWQNTSETSFHGYHGFNTRGVMYEDKLR